MSDPAAAEEAVTNQSSFFLSSKLIFLLALCVPVALLGNPHLSTLYCRSTIQYYVYAIKKRSICVY